MWCCTLLKLDYTLFIGGGFYEIFLPAYCSSSGFAPQNKSSSWLSIVDASCRAVLPIKSFFLDYEHI